MKIRLAAPLQTDSIVDGEGLRAVVWTQGCPHNCLGCHNPGTHDFQGGYEVDIKEIKKEVESLEAVEGVTLSGGDPFMQVPACLEVAKSAHKNNLNVWCYTGFVFEHLLKLSETDKVLLEFLNEIDVLIDGRFVLEFKTLEAPFRGSSNQRVIDMKKSLKAKKVVLVDKYKLTEKEKQISNHKIYI